MRLVAILALVVGLMLAGTAVYFVAERFQLMEARLAMQKAQPVVPLVEVAVTTRGLRYGEPLVKDAVRMVKWPKDAVPPGSFTDLAALLGPEGSEPRFVLRPIEAGEPLMAVKVTEFGQPAGMAQRLSPGMRAFTIRVDVTSGVSGFLAVGDFVDVIWTGQDNGQPITKLLIERLPIIAIDQQAQEDRSRANVARTVTIEASPERVALLAQAASTGKLSLTLRGLEDTALAGEVRVDQSAIVPIPVIAPVQEVAPTPTVRERRGTQDVKDVPTQ